jgi:uridine kinase
VSVLRAGATMEKSLRRTCKDIVIGKMLIQSDPRSGEPQLHYNKFPSNMHNCHVFLMDATIATGAAAMMAIRVLLDHGVEQKNIYFLTLITVPQGLHAICTAFPEIKIITSAIDEALSMDDLYIRPGIGNFGDRYFGTEAD